MYLVFSGQYYYARGGMNDYQGTFEHYWQAYNRVEEIMSEHGYGSHDWWQIVDSTTMQVVNQSSEQAYGID